MECKSLKIEVMLVAPGSVKSNLAVNHSSKVVLRPDSLYTRFINNIIERVTGHGPGAEATEKFAAGLVKQVLAKRLPRYYTAGGGVGIVGFLKWIPRGWVLNYLWRLCSQKL